MAEQFKLDGAGTCPTYEKLPVPGESIQCFSCNGFFHAICNGAGAEDRVATKTMVNSFLLASTKRNFTFNCNICMTNLEINKTETESKRVDILETKMNGIDKHLAEIKKFLTENNKPNASKTVEHKKQHNLPNDNIWSDPKRLATVKAPEPKAVLVINKEANMQKNLETRNVIEKIVMDNDIPLAETHQTQHGNMVLVCESKEARDELKDLVQTANHEISMTSPSTKEIPITIVGLPKECGNEEVIKMIVLQNQFIKKFATVNNIEEHIKIHVIKPLRNKPTVFQVLASVSPVLRVGLRKYNNKLVICLTSCKVYDRQQIKRCYNCQHLGHFAKNRPTPAETHCGKCSGKHRTGECSSEERKCINCVRNNVAASDHSVNYHKCPTFVKHQESLQKNTLNSKPGEQNERR